MAEKAKKMSEAELNQFINNELRNAIGTTENGDEVSKERELNLNMYLNRPVGDEEDGRSQIQDSTIQDVVEALLPGTLAPFISTDTVVEFDPVGIEDEEYAEDATPYINHIFMVDNPGMKIQYTWQKDAYLQKNGFVYADWCERDRMQRKQQTVDYSGLVTLINDPEIEVIEYAVSDAYGNMIEPSIIEIMMEDPSISAEAFEGFNFDVDYRRTWKEGRVKVENIAPEDVIVSSDARSMDDSRVVGFSHKVSISQLREEGYPEEKLKKLEDAFDQGQDLNGERYARHQAQGGSFDDALQSTDPSSRRVWRTVLWVRVDYDGDGRAEMRKIVRGGEFRDKGGEILLNEEADEAQMVDFTAIPMPHQLIGRCPADQAREIQKGKTALMRANMDAVYRTIEPRMAYIEELASEDTWDDLMLNIPSAPLRMEREGAVYPIGDAPDTAASYQMLEYFDRIREIRTPVTRQDQGVDVDILNDKTASEARIQANATAMKKELILRLYAESLSRLFRLINRLVIKHQDKPRMLRFDPTSEPVEIDPRFWNADMDVRVKVGLGSGTKEQQIQTLMMIHNIQMQDMQAGLPTVDPEKLYNTRAELIRFSGLTAPRMFFNEPDNSQEQAGPDPQQEQIKQAEAQAVEQAIEQAGEQGFEAGKREGVDMVKIMDIESKERMHRDDTELAKTDLAIRQQENRAQAMGFNV